MLVIILNNFGEFICFIGANKIMVTKLIESIVPIEKEKRNIMPLKKLLWFGSKVTINAPVPAKP